MRYHAGRHPRHRAPHPRHRAEGGERLIGPGAAFAVPVQSRPAPGDEGLAPAPPAALPAGTLFVVATPIGNLEDITLRALRVLREVDLVAAEDTRRTRNLLEAYGVRAALVSYFEHNQARRGPELLRRLQGGARIALVTDAGTPGVSDPGFRLVRLCRDAGVPVVPIPGASALVAALSAAGIPADRFVFEGFLPVKPGRRLARLRELGALERPVVLYESPHRLLATLEAIAAVFGEAEVVVAREVTKRFEEFRHGSAASLRVALAAGGVRGEVTLIVNPREPASPATPAATGE
jgi:16S rRNA (cytidine1402-2'-O)-methyltransferase